ncbi:hypothetical protein N1030_03975 [Desulfovibrio mangrovi]|uniref:hypothetical protein n=1 Tax=Desulfovibrio mangrovi TaxID=2976983 RepID=UPI002247DADC|nr:hypothetical protein [Desulfovibrio mangrovi]UZP68143.1 hypothetical protein N1030_03975 [Desulfovibrio mangrovi]
MAIKSVSLHNVIKHISNFARIPLYALLALLVVSSPLVASTMGTGDTERQDRTIGTFTEGMQLGTDPDTGDTILRSAPSPSNQGSNGTDSTTPPPSINIEITPKLEKSVPNQ